MHETLFSELQKEPTLHMYVLNYSLEKAHFVRLNKDGLKFLSEIVKKQLQCIYNLLSALVVTANQCIPIYQLLSCCTTGHWLSSLLYPWFLINLLHQPSKKLQKKEQAENRQECGKCALCNITYDSRLISVLTKN